jgi:hypothetical protein
MTPLNEMKKYKVLNVAIESNQSSAPPAAMNPNAFAFVPKPVATPQPKQEAPPKKDVIAE